MIPLLDYFLLRHDFHAIGGNGLTSERSNNFFNYLTT